MSIYFKTLISSIFILFASLGLGRFGYGMILPNLQESLQISTTQTGFIGTSNFVGYLIGIFFVSYLYKKFETHKLISTSLIFQSISMLCMVLFTDYLFIAAFYTLSGVFTAISNVSIMVYIAHIIPAHIKGKALGIIVTGNGLAIVFSGFLVPFIDTHFLNDSWTVNWSIFAGLTFIISFGIRSGLKIHDNKQQNPSQNDKPIKLLFSSKFHKIALLYLIFGITYVVYITFFVTASIDKYNIEMHQSGYFWSLLGFMSLFSGPLFGSIADKIGAYKTLIIIFALQTIANLILVLDLQPGFLWISAILFGTSAWAIPSLITLLSTQEFGVQNTAKVFSLATLVFAAGQIIGPIGAGFIYDLEGDFSNVFLICAILTFMGVILSWVFSLVKSPV